MEEEKKALEVGLAVAKEVYTDVGKPAFSEVGKTAGGVARIVLSPLNAMIWGFDRIVAMLDDKLTNKLSNVAPENIITPKAFIAVPALEALRYNAEIDELRNLYLNLLANSMDVQCANGVHPSFVDIIKNLSPDEAKLLSVFQDESDIPFINLKQFVNRMTDSFSYRVKRHTHVLEDYPLNLTNEDHLPIYLDNLVRIGIINIPSGYISDDTKYKGLEECEMIIAESKLIEAKDSIFEIERGFYEITAFGRQFVDLVIKDK